MKKNLLFLVVALFSVATFAQTDLQTIDFNKGGALATYSYTSPFTPSNGGNIFVPYWNYGSGDNYWDLSSYIGIELKFTCDAADVGKTMPVRVVGVGSTPSNVISIVKNLTFTSISETIDFEFATDGFETSKVWGIKCASSGTDAFNSDVTIEYINAVSTFTTLDNEKIFVEKDPNRLVKVYSISGVLIRKDVRFSEATQGLKTGLYIVDGQKIYVKGF